MTQNSSLQELEKVIADAKQQVTVGGRYSHFKNPDHMYKVLDIVIFEATEEPLVLYTPEYGDTELVFARAISKWLETVEKDGKKVQRFTPVNMV